MIIMGLDISTQATGWSVFNDNQLMDYGVILASSTNVYNRIEKITAELEELVKKYSPNYILAEEPLPVFSGHNINTYRMLTFCHGSICLMLNRYRLDMHLSTSSAWRKKVGIKTGRNVTRTELKKQSIAKAKELFNIDTKSDDLAEGVLIGYSEAMEHEPTLTWE